MTTQELMFETASSARGRILQLTIDLETRMDIYISRYFTSDVEKHKEMMMLIVSPFTLSNKKMLVEYIFSQDSSNQKVDLTKLANNLTLAIRERNIFAHQPVDYSDHAQEIYINQKQFSFVNLRLGTLDGKKEIGIKDAYDEERINSLIMFIDGINKTFDILLNNDNGASSQT